MDLANPAIYWLCLQISKGNNKPFYNQNSIEMKTYLIQRNVPGAGKFTAAERKALAQRSCEVLEQLGPQIQWLHSYITDDNLFCVYKAENVELVREHARRGDFPANYILEVYSTISPATAEIAVV